MGTDGTRTRGTGGIIRFTSTSTSPSSFAPWLMLDLGQGHVALHHFSTTRPGISAPRSQSACRVDAYENCDPALRRPGSAFDPTALAPRNVRNRFVWQVTRSGPVLSKPPGLSGGLHWIDDFPVTSVDDYDFVSPVAVAVRETGSRNSYPPPDREYVNTERLFKVSVVPESDAFKKTPSFGD